MNKLVLFIIFVMLNGCAATFDPNLAGHPPANHKDVVKKFIKDSFFDPYSIRDISITNTSPGTLDFQSGYILCIDCNSKNRMGGYIGKHKMSLLIRNDQVVRYFDNDPYCNSPELVYSPWPEMEGK